MSKPPKYKHKRRYWRDKTGKRRWTLVYEPVNEETDQSWKNAVFLMNLFAILAKETPPPEDFMGGCE
jgi:hypothetical protein